MPDLGTFLGSINVSKEEVMIGPDDEKSYLPYIITRLLSYHSDALFHANEVNQRRFMANRLHYDYLRFALKSRKRWGKWQRPEKVEELEVIKEYFGYSDTKALEALKILSAEQLEYMKSRMKTGGFKGKGK